MKFFKTYEPWMLKPLCHLMLQLGTSDWGTSQAGTCMENAATDIGTAKPNNASSSTTNEASNTITII